MREHMNVILSPKAKNLVFRRLKVRSFGYASESHCDRALTREDR